MEIKEDFVFPVYIYRDTIQKINILTKNFENEIFGYLIGNILEWNENIYVIIEEILFILGAVHSDKFSTSQIEGTAGKYEKRFQRLKKKRENDNLRIVGWWHSHPGFGCFLSTTDLKTQKYFFPESYQVTLVVDPHKDELDFFTLDKNSVKGYKSISYAILT
ncbi:MAG: Mov34/MPN/PAD-1 family protein [Candidatus Lokiarchaeota archaeon]|nr:Mov34/MPN/PAD-1 family protein [Candidatus Lokiarchaeota archaeon]